MFFFLINQGLLALYRCHDHRDDVSHQLVISTINANHLIYFLNIKFQIEHVMGPGPCGKTHLSRTVAVPLKALHFKDLRDTATAPITVR